MDSVEWVFVSVKTHTKEIDVMFSNHVSNIVHPLIIDYAYILYEYILRFLEKSVQNFPPGIYILYEL